MCRLYFRFCKRCWPGGLTVSAWLWKRELEGKGHFLRECVDDYFLCYRDQEDHCETQYYRETSPVLDT